MAHFDVVVVASGWPEAPRSGNGPADGCGYSGSSGSRQRTIAAPQGRIKIAKHHHRDDTVDPEMRPYIFGRGRAVDPRGARRTPPRRKRPPGRAATCLYTVTPDGDFLIDRWPGYAHVLLASPCSGHGFKFAPVIGEILVSLLIEGATHHDIGRFSLGRFG